MQITEKDNHVYVITSEGNYVGVKDTNIFGEALSLGINTTTEDVIEKPISEWPTSEILEEELID